MPYLGGCTNIFHWDGAEDTKKKTVHYRLLGQNFRPVIAELILKRLSTHITAGSYSDCFYGEKNNKNLILSIDKESLSHKIGVAIENN